MKNVSGKDFARPLEKTGWMLKRITGSHHVYVTLGEGSVVAAGSVVTKDVPDYTLVG